MYRIGQGRTDTAHTADGMVLSDLKWSNDKLVLTYTHIIEAIASSIQTIKMGNGHPGLHSGVDRASQKKIEIAPTSIKVATLGAFDVSDPDPE